MPRNGSGLYVPPPANYPAVSATLITAADRNAIDADLATALTNSIAVNGESVVTADIAFGNNKLTGVKDGALAKDAANVSQIQNSSAILLASVAGTDTITASLSPTLTAYANGQIFTLIPANTNTSAVTININGLGAKALTKNGSTALVAGDLVAGVEYSLQYDGTRFQKVAGSDYMSIAGGSLTGLLNVNDGADIASASTVDLTVATGNTVRITGTTAITAFTMNAGQQMMLIAVGALPLTYHATTMNINGGASYTCAANDRLSVFKDGSGVIHVNVAKQDGSPIVAAGLPAGAIIDFAGVSAPSGFLACPLVATNISRTTYAALFAAIGTTWGAGDGSTTFGMPYFPADYAAVQANGNVGTQTTGEVKSHSHLYNDFNNSSSITRDVGGSDSITLIPHQTGLTGGSANLAAGVRVLKCVKI